MPAADPPRAPGTGWYAVAVAVALIACAGAVALVAWQLVSQEEPARFLAPGSGSVEVSRPGRYVLWHEYRTVFENRTYDSAPKLPANVRFRIEAPDRSTVRLDTSASGSWNSGSVQREMFAGFDAEQTGRYTVTAQADPPQRVIAVGPDPFWPLVKVVLVAIVLGATGIGGGIALGIYVLLRREAAASPRAAPPAPGTVFARPVAQAAAAEDRSLRDLTAVVYALQAASLLLGVTLLAAVVVNYVKREDVAGTWLESHFRWQIRTFWISLLWTVFGAITLLILVGFVILFVWLIWFIYRIAKGWIALAEGKPVGA